MNTVVLIPSYKPDIQLVKIVSQLNTHFKVLVVNDGSGEEYTPIFEQVKAFADVVSHEKNKGKGSALKTGIAYIKQNYPDCKYFITADSDGQHKVEDIIRVSQKLEQGEKIVLSTRLLSKDIPFRSKFGNSLSRFIYTMLTGHYFIDNQSGLRGFSIDQADWLLTVKGNHYDYELNVLYHADRQGIPIGVLEIEAIYLDGNSSSHFNPVKDTLRIYRQLFKAAMGSLISLVFLQALIFALSFTIGYDYFFVTITSAGILSVVFNAIITNLFVLKNITCKDYGKVLLRTVIRFGVYTAFLCLPYFFFQAMPLVVSFNLSFILLIIPEYLFVKLFYKIKLKK